MNEKVSKTILNSQLNKTVPLFKTTGFGLDIEHHQAKKYKNKKTGKRRIIHNIIRYTNIQI
jgi:hypothetical protein